MLLAASNSSTVDWRVLGKGAHWGVHHGWVDCELAWIDRGRAGVCQGKLGGLLLLVLLLLLLLLLLIVPDERIYQWYVGKPNRHRRRLERVFGLVGCKGKGTLERPGRRRG